VDVKISVITVNLNNLGGLKRTVESVVNQDYPNLEYLIIDGGSKDGSKEFVEGNRKRISFFLSEKDSGVYDAMNKGVKKSTGDYLIFLNSGDFFSEPNSLTKLIANSQGEDLIFGDILIQEPDRSWIKTYPDVLNFRYFYFESMPHPATLISKGLFERHGLYDTRLKIVSDWRFFLLAVVKHQCSYLHVKAVISTFLLGGMSSMTENINAVISERRSTLKEYYNLYFIGYGLYLKLLRKSIYPKL